MSEQQTQGTAADAVGAPVQQPVRPDLVECKDIRKNVDYFLTGEFWPHSNLKVRLKRWFVAKDEWTGARGNGAIVESGDGMMFAIHPKGVVFAAPMAAPSGHN